MQTVDTSQLTDVIATFNEATEAAFQSQRPDDFENLEKHLGDVEGYVRELQQAMWAGEAEQTIARLENAEPLNATDKDVIRTFLVSDAERYLANENNYGDWIGELRRLMGDLGTRASTVSRESIGDLRGVIKDALRLLPDIRNYLDEKSRVERFDLAVDDLDPKTRKMLVRIMKEQLYTEAR